MFSAGIFLMSCQSSVRFTSEKSLPVDYSVSKKSHQVLRKDNLNDLQLDIVSEAERWLGTPYCYGGNTADCLDCSGYVQKVFEKIGFELPRTSQDMFAAGNNVQDSEAKAGDLVFFSNKGNISHVGIYLGNGNFIHSSTSKGVIIQNLNDKYYQEHFTGFRRMLN